MFPTVRLAAPSSFSADLLVVLPLLHTAMWKGPQVLVWLVLVLVWMGRLVAVAEDMAAETEVQGDRLSVEAVGGAFPRSVYEKATLLYGFTDPDVLVHYNGISSEEGLCRILPGSADCESGHEGVDFAGTDALPTPADYERFPDLQLYPTLAGAVVPIYNLQPDTAAKKRTTGRTPDLVLTPELLIQMFMGRVTQWDDPRVLAVNPGLELVVPPNQTIELVVEAECSGLTAIFKKSLGALDAVFKEKVTTGANAAEGPKCLKHI